MNFHIQLTAESLAQTFEGLTEAREAAEAITAEQHIVVQVIHTESDIVAFITTPVPVGQHFKPWERIENPKHAAPAVPGYVPAYTRKLIMATVYRPLTKGEPWMVHDGRTGGFETRPNTKTMCQLTTAMRLGHMVPNPEALESEPETASDAA